LRKGEKREFKRKKIKNPEKPKDVQCKSLSCPYYDFCAYSTNNVANTVLMERKVYAIMLQIPV